MERNDNWFGIAPVIQKSLSHPAKNKIIRSSHDMFLLLLSVPPSVSVPSLYFSDSIVKSNTPI